jgi:glycosyltransferase involved in cell wall biosynthesis
MPQAMLSIVVPVYDEAESVRELCSAIARVLSAVEDIQYEIILVDDGSRDNSWQVIHELHQQDARVKGVRLSRNFGHQAALTAGYHYAAGDAIITMDGDLQHPPEMLPVMIEKWRQGYDVVSMVREASPHEGWFKKLSSSLFYRLINALSDVTIKDAVADFRLLDGRAARQLNSMRERGRFVRGMISWIGFTETEVRYTAAPRFAGHTKYSLRKMLGLAANAVSSFSTVPLKLGFYTGIAVNALCLVLMGYAVYNKIYENKDLTEWASTFMTMLFLNGVQLLMIGVIGVYLGRVLEEVKRRPLYIAREELGLAPRRRPGAVRRG